MKNRMTFVFAAVGLLLPFGVLAQIPVGPEWQVSPSHTENQLTPSVGLAQDGSAIVVYAGDSYGNKRVRRLDRRGIPVGQEQSLHLSPEEGFPLFQELSVTREGKGVACFVANGPCKCRLLDTSGALGPTEIRCSEQEFNHLESEGAVDVATFADGHFVVSWFLNYDDADGQRTIDALARFFAADGTPLGPVILVAGGVEGFGPHSTSIAALADGQAMVVWNGDGLDPSGSGIRARVLAVHGGQLGPGFLVNSHTAGDQIRPRIAADLQNRAVVVWESIGQDGSGGGIYGQRFDRLGNRLGEEFQVTSDAPSYQYWSPVTMDRSGRFSVAFYSVFEFGLGFADILMRSFDAEGQPLGPQVSVNVPNGREEDFPSISQSDNGLINVAYQAFRNTPEDPEYNWDVLTRRFVLPCLDDTFTLCLNGGRFAVRAFWRDPAGQEELAKKIPLVGDTGGFFFFDPTNFELLVKVLDGCAINQKFWVFAAGLTDVEVDILVTDTWTGQVETFHSQAGHPFDPVQELGLLAGCAASPPTGVAKAEASAAPAPAPAIGATGSCTPSPTALCLDGGRYRVTARWGDFEGQTGSASAFPQSDGSGLFYFFNQGNLELAVKVLDGCAINSHRWVFTAGLTNVEVTLTVEEMATGTIWQRHNNLGTAFPPIFDTRAFASCPNT